MKKPTTDSTPKDSTKPPQSDKPRFPLSQALQDAEHRKRLAGSSGPASDVRRIDPKDYQPAPTSKPQKPGKPR